MGEDITDKDRIDAIESGFCVTAQDERTPLGWVRIWSAACSVDRVQYGGTLREAIDLAIIASRHAVN